MKQQQQSLFPDINPGQQEQLDEGLRLKTQATGQYISSIWSFPGSGGEQLYRWYGTLPRALVERLIALYARAPETCVLEPFMGLGTTLDVAADAHLRAVGIDSNPLACLATEARLFGIKSSTEVLKITDQIARTSMQAEGFPVIPPAWIDVVASDRYQYTRKWFREDSLAAVLRLLFHIAEVEEQDIQRLLFIAAAQVVRDVASVDPRCTHHLVTKQKPFINPVPLWRTKVTQILNAVRSTPADPMSITVQQGSALNPPVAPNTIDFTLAHPPYLGVIHYHLIHRLATDLLDIVQRVQRPSSLQRYIFDHSQLKQVDVSTDSTEAYQHFVKDFAVAMQNAIAPDGRCVVIIGDQRYKGHLRHPFTDFIHWFEQCGFMLEENFIWVLQNNGGMHVLRRGHFIDHNYILVFHKLSEK